MFFIWKSSNNWRKLRVKLCKNYWTSDGDTSLITSYECTRMKAKSEVFDVFARTWTTKKSINWKYDWRICTPSRFKKLHLHNVNLLIAFMVPALESTNTTMSWNTLWKINYWFFLTFGVTTFILNRSYTHKNFVETSK